MHQRIAARSGRKAVLYRIVVRGEIAWPLVGPLEGMTVEPADGDTVLTGELVERIDVEIRLIGRVRYHRHPFTVRTDGLMVHVDANRKKTQTTTNVVEYDLDRLWCSAPFICRTGNRAWIRSRCGSF